MPRDDKDDPPPRVVRVNLEPITPVFQTRVIVAGNALILVAAIVGIKHGHFKNSHIPLLFWVPETFVIGIGLFTGFTEKISEALVGLGREDTKERSDTMKAWVKMRDRYQRWVVYGLTVLVILAVTSLVVDTGGIVGSPFVPFLTAPAIFGPFVAKGWKPVLLIVVVVSLVIGILGFVQKTDEIAICKSGLCSDVGQVTKATAKANAPVAPTHWLYSGMAVILIMVAGGISAARLKREGKLEDALKQSRDTVARTLEALGQPHDTLTQMQDVLEKARDALEAEVSDESEPSVDVVDDPDDEVGGQPSGILQPEPG